MYLVVHLVDTAVRLIPDFGDKKAGGNKIVVQLNTGALLSLMIKEDSLPPTRKLAFVLEDFL